MAALIVQYQARCTQYITHYETISTTINDRVECLNEEAKKHQMAIDALHAQIEKRT